MIRVNFWIKLRSISLNNGTDRTQFLSWSDAAMRPDGVTPTVRPEGNDITDEFFPSLAAANTLAYAKRFTTPIMKRYVSFLNKGGIIGAGVVCTSNGESELDVNYKVGGADEEVFGTYRSHGDFHPESVAKFKALFPMYAALSNNDIATATYNSELHVKWRYHLNKLIWDFEAALMAHWAANIPGLTRVRFGQQDSGSLSDTLAFNRQTLLPDQRINPYSFLWKPNDGSNENDATLHFYLDQVSSLARRCSGVWICEPSPPFPYGNYLGEVKHEIDLIDEKGGGTSFYTADDGQVDTILSMLGYTYGATPKNKPEFKNEGGNLKLHTLTVNADAVLKGGGFGQDGYYRNAHSAFKSTQGLTACDIKIFDNINPSSGI